MIQLPLRRLRDKFFPVPLPPPNSFSGQTILITGATAGLGLAAAKQFASLGAAEIIITARNKSKGELAKKKIEEASKYGGKGKGKGEKKVAVEVLELDMNRYDSCVKFVEGLKEKMRKKEGGATIECVVLNAGVCNPTFVESSEGWEETIQVNTLSTTLLALLLLPWMKEIQTEHKSPSPPHFIFVTSRDHLDPDISMWAEWGETGPGILQHLSREENFPVGVFLPNYDISKLLLTYAAREICTQALGPDGRPQVIINTVCPGLVQTDLGRTISQQSLFMRIYLPSWLRTWGKSVEYGARSYVAACLTESDDYGKFLVSLYTDEEYSQIAFPNLESETAREVQGLVWAEIMGELTTKVPLLRNSMFKFGGNGQEDV